MELIMENNNEYEVYKKAQEKVKEIKGFYIHAMFYVVVISILIFINLKYSPDHLWFFYSMFGWGMGLLGHASNTFNWITFLGKDWEKRKLEQFIAEEEEKLNKTKYQ